MRTAPYRATEVVQKNRQIADRATSSGAGWSCGSRVDLKQFIQLPVDEPSPLAGKPLPDELSKSHHPPVSRMEICW